MRAIIRAEFLFNAKRVVTWVFIVVLIAVAIMSWTKFTQTGSSGSHNVKLAKNSEYSLLILFGAFSFILMHFTATLMTDPVARDVRMQVDPLLHSSPIRRRDYLWGKFLGNYFVLLGLYGVFGLTLYLLQAFAFPETTVLPWRTLPYLKFFLVFVVIFEFALGAFCFTIGTLTGNAKLVYGLVTGFYVLYFTISNLIRDVSNRWYSVLDPAGMIWATEQGAKDRGNAWLNANPIALNADILWNRLGLLVAGALCLFVLFRRYSIGGRTVLSKARKTKDTLVEAPATATAVAIPKVFVSAGGWRTRLAQFRAAVGAELRLLRSERSLYIMAPVIMLFCGTNLESSAGPFFAPLYPVSSEYAANSVTALLVILFGVTIFYTGEVLHRDSEERVQEILWSTPVPNGVLLLSKLTAMVLLSLGLVSLAAVTALIFQLSKNLSPVELGPYLTIYSVILLPSMVFLIAASLALNVLLRNKYMAYLGSLALGAGLIFAFIKDHKNWLYNPTLQFLWNYSDMVGLSPYRTGLLLHRIYWIAITVSAVALAHYFYGRVSGPAKQYFTPDWMRRSRTPALVTVLFALVATGTGFAIRHEIELGGERSGGDEIQNHYEDLFRKNWNGAPQPEWARVDMQVELDPPRHRLHAKAMFALENRTSKPVPALLVNIDPDFDWRSIRIGGVSKPPRIEQLARVYTFDMPLPPGGKTVLSAEWNATLPGGILRKSSGYATFIHPGGTFIGSGFTDWVPAIGYQRSTELSDEDKRKKFGKTKQEALPERKGAAFVPALFGNQNLPFDLHIEITAPKDQTAISAGRLLEVKNLGDRRTFVYEPEHGIIFFPILSAPYAERRRGNFAVYYYPGHAFNVDKLLDAMQASRKKYERDFGPFPFRDLRIVEYPRLSGFAQGPLTTIPFSESIGFLTRDDEDHVNGNYFVAAHEIGHQWFGNMVEPGESKGGNVLSEGLAEYAAQALMDETLGKKATKIFRQSEEDRYLRGRKVDKELPISTLDDSDPSHGVVRYQKAGFVFHMLETLLGKPKMNAALHEYVATYAWKESHPTIHDLEAILRKQAPDGSLDWFFDQWFHRIIVPDFRVASASMRQEGKEWVVDFTADNLNEGRMPVEVEAIARKDDKPEFKSAGIQVWVEHGRVTKGTIRCPFKPEKVILDRLYEVIDFDRANNQVTL